ncbi:NAD-dependent epimerase/dehydratase family protein [Candidatus Uhrbacteria bacterium]|nr:NAD-dependent epimerase/dehydratase family protein [Candidatus Uhrbacteria bacterium]
MAHYLVTGGAGFIGSHLVRALLAAGHRIRILDNLCTGTREQCVPEAELCTEDIRRFDAILPAFDGVDGVFHLAALPSVQHSLEYPRESHAVNVDGTLHVLEAARRSGVRRVVFSASSAAYGDQEIMPICETASLAPKSPYGLHKWIGEEYARTYARCFGLETVSLRYFNVYGHGMRAEGAYSSVIAIFLERRVAGAALTITGDGTQTRDFVHVRDVVRANMLAMTSPNVGRGEVMNIGAGKHWSVHAVAAKIGGPVTYVPARLEPHDTLADIHRAQQLLDWRPEVDFDDGIRELLALHHLPVPTSPTAVSA